MYNKDLKINGLERVLLSLVIVVHLMFFLLEAIFWMLPEVNTILIGLLDNPVTSDVHLQALTLKNLFINQGFYNLFLVAAGIVGWRLIYLGKVTSGYVLLLFLCFSATGAGITLACSTKAYILALMQALPAAVTFILLYPAYQKALKC